MKEKLNNLENKLGSISSSNLKSKYYNAKPLYENLDDITN